MHFLIIRIIYPLLVRYLKVNLTFWSLCPQSLDSSCDMVCLKERIQKSQEEREKREELLLQTQTGNRRQHRRTNKRTRLRASHSLLGLILSITFMSHDVKPEQSATLVDTLSLCLPTSFAFIVSSF